MRGFVMQWDAALGVLFAMLALSTAVAFSLGAMERAAAAELDGMKQLTAFEMADFIAKRAIDAEGNIEFSALERFRGENVSIEIAGRRFGTEPPENASVYYASRAVLLQGLPSLLEVRVW